jgi:ABC-2 type transport system ATP-binding protein
MTAILEGKTRPETPASENALVATGLTKVFRGRGAAPWSRAKPARAPTEVRAVDGLSLTVRRGEIYGLLGANGSGKSTLVRLFSTLLEPDAGTVRVFGRDIRREEMAVKAMINRVSVEASFFKKLSAIENLTVAGRLYGITTDVARRRAHEILERLDVPAARRNEPLEKLSRGMQQKVAIARAFLTSPVLLLLDEPTTGLDIRSKREVQAFVRELRDGHDATILLTTHDLEEAELLADRIGVIDRGRLVVEGTAAELKARQGGESLEAVFLALTGRRLEEADQAEGEAPL